MIVGVLPVIPTGYPSTQVTRLPSLHICATLNNTTSVRVTSVQMERGLFGGLFSDAVRGRNMEWSYFIYLSTVYVTMLLVARIR